MQRSLILLFSNDIFVQTNATAATMALNDSFNKNVPYSFNCKEAKTHGEGGESWLICLWLLLVLLL
jgi:hypothetical protein